MNVTSGQDGVEAVQDISDEMVTTPPDQLVAQEMQDNKAFTAFQKKQNGKCHPSTSIAPTTTFSNKIHLQDVPKANRMTAAAKQHMQMHNAMLTMFEKSQSKMSDEAEDDLDLSFASITIQMHSNFNSMEKEQLHMEIMNHVNEAIYNKNQGQRIIVPKISVTEHSAKMREIQL